MSRLSPRHNQTIIPLIAILLLAYALRVHGLDHHRVWYDELYTWFAASQPTPQGVFAEVPPFWMSGPLFGT